MRCLPLLAALAFVALTSTRDARADEGEHAAAPSEDAVAGVERWYGWQILVADVAAVGTGFVLRSPYPFLIGYVLGGPVVHAAHGNPGKGVASFLLRAGLPVALGAIGYEIDYASSGPCAPDQWLCLRGLEGLGLGVIAGYIGAVAIDSAALAWDRVPAEEPRTAVRYRIRAQPMVTPTRNGAVVGVGGLF